MFVPVKEPSCFSALPYSFQGEESKIIIMSLVRSNRNADIGFLRSSNRLVSQRLFRYFSYIRH